MAVHVCYKSMYIPLPSSAKQQERGERDFFKFLFQIYRRVPDSVSR